MFDIRLKILMFASAAFLAVTLIASADWRADVRARMNPEADLFAILDSRGFVLADWIGERYVEITWDGEDIALDVDSDQIADLEQWVVDDGTLVIAFSAYDGRGSYQPTGTMGLRGWVYMDDMDNLRVDLAVPGSAVIYKLSEIGTIRSAAVRGVCRCDTGQDDGCDDDGDNWRCVSSVSCPNATAFKCGMHPQGQLADFENAFATLTAP